MLNFSINLKQGEETENKKYLKKIINECIIKKEKFK